MYLPSLLVNVQVELFDASEDDDTPISIITEDVLPAPFVKCIKSDKCMGVGDHIVQISLKIKFSNGPADIASAP